MRCRHGRGCGTRRPLLREEKDRLGEKVEVREGEDREHGLSPEGSASNLRPRTLENQAQEGLNRFRSISFPPTPLKGLVATEEFKSIIKESLRHVCHNIARLEPMTLGYMGRALNHQAICCNTKDIIFIYVLL